MATETTITLASEPAQIAEFIKSLLGTPSKFSKEYYEPFEIDVNAILDLHQLLTQRVEQQNHGSMFSFRASITMSDNSRVELNSIEALTTYRETKPVISDELVLHWQFLIRFESSSVPERQEVEVRFNASRSFQKKQRKLERFAPPVFSLRSVSIQHTARTWCSDIEHLIDGFMGRVGAETGRIQSIMLRYSIVFIVLFFGLTTYSCFSGVRALTDNSLDNRYAEARSVLHKMPRTSVSETNDRIDTLARVTIDAARMSAKDAWSILNMFAYAFGVIAVGASERLWRGFSRPSFILLTEESQKNKTRSLKKYSKKWIAVFVSFIMSFVLSIAANLLTNH